jgi:U2 small nuclear ribonucleoprotein A'
MRISAERIGLAEQRTNPLGERELILRGLAIPSIENLAATRDAFDTIDFTDNRISRLENFPRMQRLVHLMLSGNVIDTVDATNLSKNVPNIKYIQLNHNHVSSLKEVSNLGTACPKLEILCLVGNPVTRKYYSFASWKSTTLSLSMGFLMHARFSFFSIMLLGVERDYHPPFPLYPYMIVETLLTNYIIHFH